MDEYSRLTSLNAIVKGWAEYYKYTSLLADIEQITRQLDADITNRQQTRWQTAFREEQPRILLELLQADFGLVLTGPQLQLRPVFPFDPCILQQIGRGRSIAEIRHEAEIEVLEQRTLNNRPRPAQQESVARMLERRPAVLVTRGLDVVGIVTRADLLRFVGSG